MIAINDCFILFFFIVDCKVELLHFISPTTSSNFCFVWHSPLRWRELGNSNQFWIMLRLWVPIKYSLFVVLLIIHYNALFSCPDAPSFVKQSIGRWSKHFNRYDYILVKYRLNLFRRYKMTRIEDKDKKIFHINFSYYLFRDIIY